MKLLKKHLLLILIVLTATNTQTVYAKLKTTPIYIYGFAASFNDSTVFFTDIQELDTAVIEDKGNFLYGRDAYSYQLKSFLQKTGETFPTCITLFATKKKKIEKHYMKMRKRYMGKDNHNIQHIKRSDFKYTAVTPEPETKE